MNPFAKSFTLSACALAAALLVSACGGGSTIGTNLPPTVAITSAASGATVTFTFTFSEDVGTSFTAEDVVVTGGTPATAVTRVDATHYTLAVTPTTGTLSVTVPAYKYDSNYVPNTVSATATYTPPATAPTTAPTTTIPSGALTIYSDAASVANFNPFPNWGQATTYSEVTIDSNKSLKYVFPAGGSYEGLDWAANPVDVSAKTKLHLDLWSADLTSVKISLISAGKENAYTQAVTAGSWNSVDIDLSNYTVADKTAIIQIKLETTAAGTLYVDNIYFSGSPAAACSATALTCAPTTVIPAGAITLYSDATTIANFNPFPNWGQATTFAAETIAGNNVLKYSGLTYEGIDWGNNGVAPVDVSAKGKLHLDIWSGTMTSVNISLITSALVAGTKHGETAFTVALTPGIWNSVDIDLSNFTAPNLAAVDQIKFDTSVPAAGIFYVDNIYFWGTPTAVVGGGGATACADPGCGGVSAVQAMTVYNTTGAPSCGLPNQPLCLFANGDYIFAEDYKGLLDVNNRYATVALGAVTQASALYPSALAGGSFGYYYDPAIDAAGTQKIYAQGWATGTSAGSDPYGSPNFFVAVGLTPGAVSFANSYMGVFVNAPQNGIVDVSARTNVKLRLWGPGPMYQSGIPGASNHTLNPVLEVIFTGPKVAGCGSGSGGSEIHANLTANLTIGGAAEYTLPLSNLTAKTLCSGDSTAASVLSHVARVVVNVPGSSFNFTNPDTVGGTNYSTGVNIGAISFK